MGRVWLRARSACPPSLPVPVCGVGARAGVWVSAASRLPFGGVVGCVCARAPVPRGLLRLLVGVAVRGCVFVRAPRLFPAFPRWGAVCGRACWARVSAVPRHSWLGCRGAVFALCFLGRVLVWLCGVSCWLSLSRALWSLSPHPLSCGLGCWLFFFFSSVVCVCMFRCPSTGWAAVPGLVLPVFAGWSPCASLGLLSSVPSGWGVWPPNVVLAGGLVAVGCSLAPPPPAPPFFSSGGPACSSLCLPWAGARTGPHSVWSSGLLLAVAFCLAKSRPHRSAGLCARWARRPFLPGEVLALPAGRLRQAAACGSGLGGWGCPCPFPSAVPVLTFWVVRDRCCQARMAPCVARGAGVWRAGAAPSGVFGGLFRLVLQVRVSRAVFCRSVLRGVASCCGALLCGVLWCSVPCCLALCRGGSVEVSLACVVVRSAGWSVAGWWLGGAVRCGCLPGCVLLGPGRAARAAGSGRRAWGCPPLGLVHWSRVLWESRSLALVAVAVRSSSSGAYEVALVAAWFITWQ